MPHLGMVGLVSAGTSATLGGLLLPHTLHIGTRTEARIREPDDAITLAAFLSFLLPMTVLGERLVVDIYLELAMGVATDTFRILAYLTMLAGLINTGKVFRV